MFDFLINIAFSLITGVISGLVVARAAALKSLTRQAHNTINNWEYMRSSCGKGWDIDQKADTRLLQDIASNLFYLKQVDLGKAVQKAANAIQDAQSGAVAPTGSPSLHQVDANAHKWIREAKINWKAILLNGPL